MGGGYAYAGWYFTFSLTLMCSSSYGKLYETHVPHIAVVHKELTILMFIDTFGWNMM